MAGPPNLSDEDRARALAKAAEVRRVRAQVREALRTGGLTLAEVLDRVGEEGIGGIKVKAVLTALPGLGKVKSYRLMEAIGIAENRRLRGLGPKQKEALLASFS
ncbi:MAG TPA: integration host factor [Actinobacteria bacterium]|nr:integration host factor [Actinomycetota bacterium]